MAGELKNVFALVVRDFGNLYCFKCRLIELYKNIYIVGLFPLIAMKRNRSYPTVFRSESHVRALRPDDDESKILEEPQEFLGINHRKLLHLERLPAL